jgi:hypothetical protein
MIEKGDLELVQKIIWCILSKKSITIESNIQQLDDKENLEKVWKIINKLE